MGKEVTVQLSEAGQINIPAAVRDVLNWQTGIELSISIISSTVLLQPKRPQKKKCRLEELRGFLKHHGKPLSDDQLCSPVDCKEDE